MRDMNQLFGELSRSPYRRRSLDDREREYLEKKGLESTLDKAREYIEERLVPQHTATARPIPEKGHPVCVAMHATATENRSNLERWHDIEKGRDLRPEEVSYLVDVVKAWLNSHS